MIHHLLPFLALAILHTQLPLSIQGADVSMEVWVDISRPAAFATFPRLDFALVHAPAWFFESFQIPLSIRKEAGEVQAKHGLSRHSSGIPTLLAEYPPYHCFALREEHILACLVGHFESHGVR